MLRKLVCGFTNTVYTVNKENKYKVSMLVIYINYIKNRHIFRAFLLTN